MHPKTHYARSGDVCIAYQVTGAGPIDVVMAPGTMSHLDLDWEIPNRAQFFERLSRICRLIRFDKRGTGLSDRPVAMATLEQRTDDIRAVMDAVGIERANLFGASEGGSMVSLFAATYPERVDSLMIWGAQATWIAVPGHPWGQTAEEHEAMLAMIRDDWPSREYLIGPGAGLGPQADPAYVEAVARYMRAAASPSAVLAYERMNGQIDTRPILPAIRARALVMNREGDPVAHVDAARDMAMRIPGARFKAYPGNSHSMMLPDMDLIIADMQEFLTGERTADRGDRVLATVLFLDIAGSTDLASRLGDAGWRNLQAQFYMLVRKELARHGGVEIDTAGDGVLATFDGPARAARCAMALVNQCRQLGVQARAGVHTGECERREEAGATRIGGMAVHIGSRIQSMAVAGQVLASRTVKDLVGGSGILFHDCGEHVLRGVPGTWQLYAVAEGT